MADPLPWLVPVALIALAMVALALRRRILVRVALRNVVRRKTQVAIAVVGLLVGTSIISGSLIIGDTFDASIKRAVFEQWDRVDEIVTSGPEAPRGDPFAASVVDDLRANLSTMPDVHSVSGRLWLIAGATDLRTSLIEVRANLLGFDAGNDSGSFVTTSGSTQGSELGNSEVFVDRKLADGLEARSGDRLEISFATRAGPVAVNFTVRDVVEDYARGGDRKSVV